MASKGAIIVLKKEKNTHFLATQGFSKEIDLSLLFKDLNKNKNQTPFDIDNKKTSINRETKEELKNQKIKILIPLFHKQDLLGVFCIGNKFMNQSFTGLDIKIMSIISSHLTKALYNHLLIKELDEKKREINLKLLELETLFSALHQPPTRQSHNRQNLFHLIFQLMPDVIQGKCLPGLFQKDRIHRAQ